MLKSLTSTILQTGICNFEFYCHYPLWYLTHEQENVCSNPLVIVHFDISESYEQFSSITPDLIGNWGTVWYSRIWFYPATDSSSGGRIRVAAVSRPGSWIQVTADSILRLTRVLAAGYELRLTRVPAAGYELQLTLSYGWLELQHLDKT